MWATEDFWQYFEPVRTYGEPKCIQTIENVVATLDNAIAAAGKDDDGNYVRSPAVLKLMKLFGLEELESVQDWATVVSYPLTSWQAQNWDPSLPGTDQWARFCVALTANLGKRDVQFPLNHANNAIPDSTEANPLSNYADYVKNSYVIPCHSYGLTVEQCFGTRNLTVYYDTSLSQTQRLWPWQVCLEWGYNITPAPSDRPSLISRTLGADYKRTICNRAFNFAAEEHTNVTRINQWGNFSLEAERLLYVDGDQDPWLWATVHSPLAEEAGANRTGGQEGVLLETAWHHNDENGLGDVEKEPERIRAVHGKEIEVVRGWVEEWKEEVG